MTAFDGEPVDLFVQSLAVKERKAISDSCDVKDIDCASLSLRLGHPYFEAL